MRDHTPDALASALPAGIMYDLGFESGISAWRRRPRIRGVDADMIRAEPSAEGPRYSGRGFAHFDPIEGRYGGSVEVYESSAASAPCMWVGIIPPSSGIGPVVHLHLDDAARLRDQLTYLIEHHYQLEQR